MFKITHQHRRFDDPMRTVALFADCTDAEIARVMSLVTPLDIPEGRLLTRQGEAGRECFVVIHGDAIIERNGVVMAHAYENDIVGELALIDHIPRTATVTTTRPTRLLVMSQRKFNGLRRLGIPGVTQRLNAAADAHRAAVRTNQPECLPDAAA